MNYSQGTYLIIRHAYWTLQTSFIIIVNIDFTLGVFTYKYEEDNLVRERSLWELKLLELLPASSLHFELF